jgi:glucose-6-phosphate isomerase
MPLISYDPTGVLLADSGLEQAELTELGPRLAAARDETLADVALWNSGGEVPPAKQPLDAGFIELPERLLTEYREHGAASVVGRIQAAAHRVAADVDRVVVLGIGGSYMGARAMFEACRHPYYNELSRADREGQPRIYFEGDNVDNDATQGLLDLLRGESKTLDERWAITVISKSGGTLETAAAFRIFLAALRENTSNDAQTIAERVVPVTGPSGKLFELSAALGCPEVFEIPDGVGGRFSVLTPVGLLPAALMGLDIVQLLEGALAMNEHFRTAAPGENAVLDFVGVGHLMENYRGATIRVLSTWGKQLEAVGLWYDQLLAESLGKEEQGATPLTVVNTRDLHSRGQQHQEGRRDKLITNLIVSECDRPPLAIGHSDWDQDQLNALADKTLPDVLRAAIAGTNQAYREDGRPTADLVLPRVDEHTLGQLFQHLMLATVVEGRLIGINPYGQPGVEAYKRHMNEFLRR